MYITTSDGLQYRVEADPDQPDYALITGSQEALTAFTDTLTLTGTSKDGPGGVIPVQGSQDMLRTRTSNVAIFLDFEVLNML